MTCSVRDVCQSPLDVQSQHRSSIYWISVRFHVSPDSCVSPPRHGRCSFKKNVEVWRDVSNPILSMLYPMFLFGGLVLRFLVMVWSRLWIMNVTPGELSVARAAARRGPSRAKTSHGVSSAQSRRLPKATPPPNRNPRPSPWRLCARWPAKRWSVSLRKRRDGEGFGGSGCSEPAHLSGDPPPSRPKASRVMDMDNSRDPFSEPPDSR